MKITPLNIQQKKFRVRLRGFDVREVDGYLEQIVDELKILIRENENQKQEIQRLNRELQGYRDREIAFKDAMVNAQKGLDDMRANVKKEAN